jgi:hypothetical protein
VLVGYRRGRHPMVTCTWPGGATGMRLIRDDKTGFAGERALVSAATRSPIR